MSKILITGDIHIFPYVDYNLETDFRLNQFDNLAHRLVEIANLKDCSKLAIAGDLLHKAVLSPVVANRVKTFFKILSSKFKKEDIWLIYGNHDVNSKSQNIEYRDSTLLAYDEFFTYSDQKIFEFNNRKIALANWRPVQDLSFIEEQVDLFIGHVTIDERYGQEIDHTKFKLGLAGDIHHIVNVENLHSINVPIPHYISDEQIGSVVVYDPMYNTFERVITESDNYRHLKIYYEENTKADFTDFLTMKVKSPTKIKSVDYVHRSIDLDTIISNVVDKANLSNIHSEYLTKIPNNDSKPLDLNFTIRNIKIENFLSIESLDLKLDSGLIALSGKNGNGKSSLIRAIDFVLRPPRQAKDFVKFGEKSLFIEIELDYKGRLHKIQRTAGTQSKVSYLIDGVEQVANSITDLNKQIEDNLEFLQLFDILYRYQSAPYLLSGFNYSQRIELVSKLLGLNKIDNFYQITQADYKVKRLEFDKIQEQYNEKASLVAYLTPMDYSKAKSKLELEKLCLTLTEELNRMDSDWVRLNSINQKNFRFNTENQKVLLSRRRLLDTISDVEKQLLDLGNVVELRNQYNEGIVLKDEMQDRLDSYTSKTTKRIADRSLLENEIKTVESELRSIKLSDKKCSSCGREFDNAEEIQKHYDLIAEKLANLTLKNQGQIYTINEELRELDDLAKKQRLVIADVDSMLNAIQQKIITVGNLTTKLDNLNQELSNLPESITDELELIDLSGLITEKTKKQTELSTAQLELAQAIKQAEDLAKLEELEVELSGLDNSMKLLNSELEQLDKYKNLFHSTGSIVKSVFMTVAELLTENEFIVRTVKTLKNGDIKIDFDIDYLVNGTLIPYQNLSGGQKVLVDIFFMSKLFKMSGIVGLLMLDETLKDLDTDNLDKAIQILKDSPISTILLVTHVESFNHYNLKYNVMFDDGKSTYKIEG